MIGHGHVIPRADGSKSRCGGPALCMRCAQELIAEQATQVCHLIIEKARLTRALKEATTERRSECGLTS